MSLHEIVPSQQQSHPGHRRKKSWRWCMESQQTSFLLLLAIFCLQWLLLIYHLCGHPNPCYFHALQHTAALVQSHHVLIQNRGLHRVQSRVCQLPFLGPLRDLIMSEHELFIGTYPIEKDWSIIISYQLQKIQANLFHLYRQSSAKSTKLQTESYFYYNLGAGALHKTPVCSYPFLFSFVIQNEIPMYRLMSLSVVNLNMWKW